MSARSPFRRPASGVQRRSEEFARLLELGPSAGSAANDPTLAPLAALAGALRSLPLSPTPDFRDGLRQRLVAVATVQGIGVTATHPAPARDAARAGAGSAARPAISWRVSEWAEGWRVRRRLVAATAALSAVVMVGGAGLAGSRSLPGDPFYGVKRGVESLQLAAAHGDEAKGERHLEFAQTRLREVSALIGSNRALGVRGSGNGSVAAAPALGGSLSSRVLATLKDMDEQTRAGQRDLTRAYAKSHATRPLHTLTTFATEQGARLAAVLPDLPAAVTPDAQESLVLVRAVGAAASRLLADVPCSAACENAPQTPAGTAGTPTPGLTPAPCTCGTADGSGGSGATPAPTLTPGPEESSPSGGQPSPAPTETRTASPSPSASSPTLQDQIGGIISQLPIPIPTPPVPLAPPPLPSALPTIHLP